TGDEANRGDGRHREQRHARSQSEARLIEVASRADGSNAAAGDAGRYRTSARRPRCWSSRHCAANLLGPPSVGRRLAGEASVADAAVVDHRINAEYRIVL